MKLWSTTILAIDPVDGHLKKYGGPNIPAPSAILAHEHCQHNGLGYCNIGEELVSEIPCDDNFKADFSKAIDYDTIQNN
jgi:hypothetical protein